MISPLLGHPSRHRRNARLITALGGPTAFAKIRLTIFLILCGGAVSTASCGAEDDVAKDDSALSRLLESKPSDVDDASVQPPAAAIATGYSRLVFSDEFNHPLDRRKWWPKLWYEKPGDTGAPSQAFTSNGILQVQMQNEDGRWRNLNLVSVAPDLSAGHVFRYGYFEARIKLPVSPNVWPAFWLISLPHALDPAQPAGELDVVEGSGSKPSAILTTLHRDSSSPPRDSQNAHNWADFDLKIGDDFHTYAALWTPDRVEWYFDGEKVNSAPAYDTTGQAMMLILSLGPGDVLGDPHAMPPGPPGATKEVQIDWVRVWQAP